MGKKVLYYYAIWEIWWLKWLQSNIGEIAEIFIYTIQLLLVDRQAERHSTVSSLPARMAPARGSLRTMTCAMKELHLGGLEL